PSVQTFQRPFSILGTASASCACTVARSSTTPSPALTSICSSGPPGIEKIEVARLALWFRVGGSPRMTAVTRTEDREVAEAELLVVETPSRGAGVAQAASTSAIRRAAISDFKFPSPSRRRRLNASGRRGEPKPLLEVGFREK